MHYKNINAKIGSFFNPFLDCFFEIFIEKSIPTCIANFLKCYPIILNTKLEFI